MWEELERFLSAAAAYQDVPDRERAAKWAARLRLNRPEIDRFTAEPSPLEPPYLSPADVKLDFPAVDGLQPEHVGAALIADEVAAGAIDPCVRVAERIARIRAEAGLNAFITVDENGAMAQAVRIRDRVRAGRPIGRLAGSILAVKDLMAVQGLPLTAGSKAIEARAQNQDATIVARLRAEDAIIIGTTNLHEFAYGITSENPHFGWVGNPRATGRIAGGSSGGSAAAVAAGLADLAIGTDTAGSIRIPAACCGVVGFKPTFDALPREGVLPLSWSLDHVGPMAASVADTILMFEVIAGLAPGAVTSPATAVARRRFRLVRPLNYFTEIVAPGVAAAFDAVLERLAMLGHDITERHVEGADLAPAVQFFTLCPEATQEHEALGLAEPAGLGEDVRVRLEIGRFLAATDYVKAQRLRRRLANAFMQALSGVDALLIPTLLTGAPPRGAQEVTVAGHSLFVHTAMTRCTAPFNLAGMPAITLPCGTDESGLPVGLQIVGRPGFDITVLGIALAAERTLAGGV
jgi:Asp-tRNA(Asn)/Glu-tRNA(Gln) amidotransferase A subunit family amidase